MSERRIKIPNLNYFHFKSAAVCVWTRLSAEQSKRKQAPISQPAIKPNDQKSN